MEILQKNSKNHAARVVVLVFVILLLFAGSVFFVFLPSYGQSLINAKYNLIHEMVNSQISLIERYDRLVQAGELSLEEAQTTVINIMRDIRFGPEEKDYFWINDFHPILLMHPYRTDLEGDDLAEFFDANGRPLLKEFVKIVEESNEGFHEYPWQMYEDQSTISSKLSFIKGYKPWGWIVGSGIYLDDVNAKIAATERNLVIFFVIVFLCAVITSWIIIKQSINQDRIRNQALSAMQESEQRLSDILSFLPDATFVIDKNRIVIAWNKAMEELSGVKAEDILGKGDNEYALPFYGKRRNALCDILLDSKQEHEHSYDSIKHDLHSITAEGFTPKISKYLQGTASLLFGINGEVTGVIETLRDITESKQNEQTIKNQYELFDSLLTSIPLPVFYKDAEGKYLGCNQAFSAFTGKTKHDIENKLVHEIWPNTSAKIYAEKDQALLDAPSTQQYQTRMPNRNNEMRDIIINKSVFYDLNGNIAGIIGIFQDITDELKTKAALQESESKLRAIFNQSFQFMGMVSISGHILSVNQTALDFAGIKEEDIVGEYFPDTPYWSKSPDRNRCIEAIQKAACGETVRFQTSHPNKNFETHYIDFSLKPFYDENEQILYLIAEGRDVTEYVELENQLRQTQKMEAIGTLAGGIAHDFNNMLFAIQGYNELAFFEAPENSTVRERLDQSQKAIVRAQSLVKQILAFSRKVEHTREPLELNYEISEIFQLIHSTLPSTIQVNLNLHDHPIYSLADATQLHQVLMNLCTNSAHALQDCGSHLTITLSHETIDETAAERSIDIKPGRYAKIQVSDDGVGIPPEILNRIFEPFFTTKPKGEGTGLGLSVIHGIIKSHDGVIMAESKPQQGATFTIYLPEIDMKIKENHKEEAPIATQSKTVRILYVDDELDIIDINKHRLIRAGYEITGISDSEEAFNLIQTSLDDYDVIITDQTMPKYTGLELAKAVFEIRPDFPLILCSGYTNSEVMNELERLGVRKFLAKPFTNDHLIEAINKILA